MYLRLKQDLWIWLTKTHLWLLSRLVSWAWSLCDRCGWWEGEVKYDIFVKIPVLPANGAQ